MGAGPEIFRTDKRGTVTRDPGVDEGIPMKASKIEIRSLTPFPKMTPSETDPASTLVILLFLRDCDEDRSVIANESVIAFDG